MTTDFLTVAIFPSLFVMVVVWFVLITRLFKKLEHDHPDKYAEMGRPSLFLRNSISSNFATMKFLFAREHKALNDAKLSKLSDSMLAFFLVYLVLFFSLFFMTVLRANHVA